MTISIPLPGGLGDSQAVLEDARLRTRRRRRRQLGIAVLGSLALGGTLYAVTASGTAGSPPSSDPSSTPNLPAHAATAPVARLVNPAVILPTLPAGLALVADGHGNSSSAPFSYGDSIMYSSATATRGTNVPTEQLFVSVSAEVHAFSYNAASCGGPRANCSPQRLIIAGVPATGMTLSGSSVVWWNPKPNVSVTVSGHGMNLSLVEQIARQLRLAPAATRCIANSVARHTGECAPGLNVSSPPDVLAPSAATKLADGVVNGSQWVLYGAISADQRRTWVEMNYRGETANLVEAVPVADSSMTNTRNGRSFVMGLLPASTTRIAMPDGTGRTVSIAPSKLAVHGWRFFGVPASATLRQACTQLVQAGRRTTTSFLHTEIKYYQGSQLLGTLSACNTGVQFAG